MVSTLAITRLIQTVQALAEQATRAKLLELGWTADEIDQAIRLGLLELSEAGSLLVTE